MTDMTHDYTGWCHDKPIAEANRGPWREGDSQNPSGTEVSGGGHTQVRERSRAGPVPTK